MTTIKKIRDEEGDGVLTITELAIRYYKFAQDYYVKNGKPTTEADGIKMAIRDLRKMYAETLITDFGPSSLKTLREVMISRNLSRTTINKQIRRITRMFRWGVSENLVRPEILTALQSIPGLKAGRSSAREPEKVKPVSEQELDSVRPYLNPVIQAMVEVQRLTGMRPGEIVGLTPQDIDFKEAIWSFRPPSHKTQHFQKERVIYFGPLAQEVIKPWLNAAEPDACIFSPAVAEALRYQKLRATRRTKVQPSQISRAKSKPEKKPGKRYTVNSYRRAINYACKKAGIKPWHPNQLRHLAATNLRREFGIEVARAVLGHSSVDMTEVYAEMDATKARDAMAKSG